MEPKQGFGAPLSTQNALSTQMTKIPRVEVLKIMEDGIIQGAITLEFNVANTKVGTVSQENN